MSFISAQKLLACRAYPQLSKWLSERGWWDFYDTTYRKRGEAYAKDGCVLEISGGRHFEEGGGITAKVKGSGRKSYWVEILFFDEGSRKRPDMEVDVMCTCPVGYQCKHGAAVLTRLSEIASAPSGPASVSSPEIARWLGSLQSALHQPPKAAKKPSKDFLAYCIEPDWSDRLCLQLHRATPGPRGIKFHQGNAKSNPSKPPAYVTDDDYPLMVRFHRLAPDQWNPVVPLDAPGVAEILLGALALDSLFYDSNPPPDRYGRSVHKYERIQPGPLLSATPTWENNADGSTRPVVELRDPENVKTITQAILFASNPPLYLDPSGPRLGEIQSSTAVEVLNHWMKGPVISAEQLESATDALEALAAPLPAPLEVERVQLPKTKPAPHLRLRPADPKQASINVIGDLRFRYGDHPLVRPLAHNALPTTTWKEGDKRLVLTRDTKAEAKFGKQLHELGFNAFEEVYRNAPEDLLHTFIPDDLGPPPAFVWIQFLEEDAPSLRAQGWTIEVDPDAGLNLFEIDNFTADLDSESDHGIDWFQLDLQIEIDGHKISLIPAIAHLIKLGVLDDDAPELPDPLLLPVTVPAEGFVRLPLERMLELCRSVGHLLHGRDPDDGPLKIDRLAAAAVAEELSLDDTETLRALAELGRKLRDITGLPEIDPPKQLQADLRPYQLDGFRWLQFLREHQLHGILADDMGLGKTVQTLAHLAASRSSAKSPALVVAPTSVIGNWAAEAARFTPELKVLLLHGPDRHELMASVPKADLVLTSFPLLARDQKQLIAQPWDSVVLDEAQYIKNPKTAVAKAACKLKSTNRLCLSGTPMENHLGELWSLMRFLMPGFLGDEKSFNATLRRPIERHRDGAAQHVLNRKVAPLLLRRTKDEVASDLPEKTEIVHRVTLSNKELDLYESVRALMDKRVRDALAERGLGKSHIIVLDALLKLRQVCCHPSLLKTPAALKLKDASKFEFLTADLLPTLIEEGRRILIFSSFTSVLSLIEEDLKKQNIDHLKLTGRTKNRPALIKTFQKGNTPVFLISLKAGGTGLNLTAADTVIHYDPWWNPAAENQATDRAHRIGQNKPVFVHKLICQGSIEDRILELQAHKARLIEALLSEDTSKLRLDESTLSALLAPIG